MGTVGCVGYQGDVVETDWAKESGGSKRTSWAEGVLEAILEFGEGRRDLANVLDSLYECRQGQQLQGRAYLGSQKEGYGGGELKLRYLCYPR